jgi:hypothetical protein
MKVCIIIFWTIGKRAEEPTTGVTNPTLPLSLMVHDQVLMDDHSDPAAKGKLESCWSEPSVAEKCLDCYNYVLRELDSSVLHRPVSGDNIKLYH